MNYIKTTYDKDGVWLSNKKVSNIRKSTFEKEIATGNYELVHFDYKDNYVKETKTKRIELSLGDK